MSTAKEQKPTTAQFKACQQLFDFFNRRLFKGELEQPLLNLSRLRGAMGFFAPNRWNNDAGKVLHEISLNPECLHLKPKETCDTLVHEMCHLWQQQHGNPPRRAYHDKAFAEKMEEVGLITSDTGYPGGRRTGQKMSDYPIEGGVFEKAFDEIPPSFFLPFKAVPFIQPIKESKAGKKVKYTCPDCGCNAWGKPELSLICGECYENGKEDFPGYEAQEPTIVRMISEDQEEN